MPSPLRSLHPREQPRDPGDRFARRMYGYLRVQFPASWARFPDARAAMPPPWRTCGPPDPCLLVRLLKLHRKEQERERATAAELWTETGYVFTTQTGKPLNPRCDYDEWKLLLGLAKLPDGRLHDARHTAATVLLLLRVGERTVMGIMGWSNTAMAARYQHITAQIRRDVAERVGGLLWELPEDGDDGAAGVPVTAA